MLELIVPRTGEIQIWGLDNARKGKGQKQPAPVWLPVKDLSHETLTQALATIQANGATDYYFTIGSFEWGPGQLRRRLANAVKFLRSYAVDMDAHGREGQYANPDEAFQDLMRVCGQIGLLPTLVVNSGRGVQAYWTTNEDMTPKEWRNLSEHMLVILTGFGLKLDRQIHGDRARVMRIPGTHNSRSGTYSSVLYQGASYPRRSLMKTVKALCEKYAFIAAPPPTDIVPQAAVSRTEADVYQCEDNEKRLRALMQHVPPIYDDDGDYGRYQLWRDTIWGIKRTGLDCAWDVAYEYAQRSSHAYDDWYYALERTWNSDKESGGAEVKAGTLVFLARRYGKGMSSGKMGRFRFLTEEDLLDLEEEREADRTSGIFSIAGHLSEADIEGHVEPSREDPDDVEEDEEPIAEAVSVSAAPDTLSAIGWEQAIDLHAPRPVIFTPDDMGAGVGGPGSQLPAGLKWDKHGRGCLYRKPKAGGDEDEFDADAGLKPVLESPIAYVGRIQNITTEMGVKSQGFDVFRVYDITGRYQMLNVPMADMENPTELMKLVKGHGGEICAAGGQKGANLVSYLNTLSLDFRKRAEYGGNIQVVKQGGWQRANPDDSTSPPIAFLLGDKVIRRTGLHASFRLSQEAAEKNRYLGLQAGTLEGCKKVLAAYNSRSHGSLISKVFCAWMLGTVLGEFLPHRQAVPYLYSNRGSKGKTSMVNIASNMWGQGRNLMLNTGSTRASLLQYFSFRGSLPTFMDDVSAGNQRFSLEDYKNLILSSTQTVEAAASNSSGTGLARGGLLLKGALCLSGNVPLSRIMDDKGSSVEAAYRRVCLMRWAVMPEFDTDLPPDRRPPAPNIDGLALDQAMHTHYGHIGPMFIQWCLDNMEFVMAEINRQYNRLREEACTRSGRGYYDNFIISTQACARFGAIWLAQVGLVPGWDMQEVVDCIDHLADDTHEEVRNLTAVDPNNLWNNIVRKALGRIVVVEANGSLQEYDIPQSMAVRMGPVMRYNYQRNEAHLSVLHCRVVTMEHSCDWSETDAWIMQNYAVRKTRFNLGAGIKQMADLFEECYVVPLERIVTVTNKAPSGAQDALAPPSAVPSV